MKKTPFAKFQAAKATVAGKAGKPAAKGNPFATGALPEAPAQAVIPGARYPLRRRNVNHMDAPVSSRHELQVFKGTVRTVVQQEDDFDVPNILPEKIFQGVAGIVQAIFNWADDPVGHGSHIVMVIIMLWSIRNNFPCFRGQ